MSCNIERNANGQAFNVYLDGKTEKNLKTNVGFNQGIAEVGQIANAYKAAYGVRSHEHNAVFSLYEDVSKDIAETYSKENFETDQAKIDNSYEVLMKETKQQYEFIVDNGLTVIRHDGEGEPYANSKQMLQDVRENKTLRFLPNDEAFGDNTTDTTENIGLQKSGIKLEDGYEMTNSELFRVVHDYFGHGILGSQFGAIGEENATLQHLTLFSAEAAPALIFQTRGQNSWVNFSGANKEAKQKFREAASARKKGEHEKAKELQKEGIGLFKFAKPIVSLFKGLFNFRFYETARRLSQQKEIDRMPAPAQEQIPTLLRKYTKQRLATSGIFRNIKTGKVTLRGVDAAYRQEIELDPDVDYKIKKAFPKFKGVQKIYEITDGAAYRELMLKALEGNTFRSSVTVYSAEEFSKMRMFVTEDGSTGITLTEDGFLGGGFSDTTMGRPQNLSQLMVVGIKEGAITAEAFDTVLPNYYSKFGFKAVSRTAFNDEFRPQVKNGALEDWDYNKYEKFSGGRPDVVFFIYDGGDINTIEDRLNQFDTYDYEKQNTKFFDKNSYDGAYAYMEKAAVKRAMYDEKLELTQNNKPTEKSKLFKTLISNALIGSEEAVDTFLNIYTTTFKKKFGDWEVEKDINPAVTYETGEPKVFYLTPSGMLTENYKEALENTPQGTIQVGFVTTKDISSVNSSNLFKRANNDLVEHNGAYKLNNKEGFLPVLTINANSNPTSKQGFINHGIRRGIISPTKKLVGDTYFLKGYGELDSLSQFNAQIVAWEASLNLGSASVVIYEDGTFELTEEDKNSITLVGANGAETLSRDEVKRQLENGKFKELAAKYDGFLEAAYMLFRQDNQLYNKTEVNTITEQKNEDARMVLLNTLSKLGISVTSLSNYIQKYNARHGQDPSVEALADIANKVVAFAEGKDTVENLTEETAHFIIEAYEDQATIERMLGQVEETAEWKEHSGRYYQKYGERYEGAELDTVVRKEVLGKILAKKIQDRFNMQEATQEEQSLFSSLRDMFSRFLDKIRGYFSQQHRATVDSVLEEIAEKVVNQEIQEYLDPSLLDGSDLIMYSLENKQAIVAIKKARQQLEKRLDVLKKTKDVNSVRVQQEMNKLAEAIETKDEWHGIKVIVSSLEPQVNNIKSQLEHYAEQSKKDDNKTAYFTQEEQQAFRSITDDFLPILEELRAIIPKNLEATEGVNKERTLSQIDDLIQQISRLKGEDKVQGRRDANAIFNRIADQYGLSEKDRSALESLIERDLKETSWFQSKFGSLEHASNPFLNLLGKIISDNNYKANTNLLRNIAPFLKKVDNQNWDLKKFEALLEKGDGEFTGFTKSPYMWAKFKKAEREAQAEAFNKTFNDSLSVEEYEKGLKDKTIPRKSDFSIEELATFNGEMAKWYEENTEKRYTKEFYDKKKKLYEDLGVSEETIAFLQEISIQRYFILSKYIKPNGQLDYSQINSRDRQQLALLTQRRKAAKSTVDAETGERKSGTELYKAEDLQLLDAHYQANKRDFVVKDSFYETIRKIEKEKGSAEAFEWLKMNGGIVFNDNFWNSFKKGRESLVDRLKNVRESLRESNPEGAEKLHDSILKLEELLEKKTEILKQYQVANNPSEINYDIMSGYAQLNLKNIEAELQEMFRSVNAVLRSEQEDEVSDPTVMTENTTNEAYKKALADSNVSELDFILQHVTESDSNRIKEFKDKIKRIQRGSTNIDLGTRRFLEQYFDIADMEDVDMVNMLAGEDLNELTVAYGRTRLLPYFKRFAPMGYDEFLQDLKTGNQSVTQFVEQARAKEGLTIENPQSMTDVLSVSTQFAWTEDEAGSEMLNPNYDENFEGGIRQPKVDKYLNKEFFQEFGINRQEFDENKNLVATRNQEQFNMLQELWGIKRKGLEALNEAGSQNIYKIPQVSKGTIQRTKDFLSKSPAKTVGNSIKDIIYNRVDDKGYGERLDGEDIANVSDLRLIPKYYLQDLEEASDVSTELAYSYSLFLQSAYTYEQRLNSVSEVMVLEQKLLDSNFENGKQANTTEAYKMFKNFMDAYFFGIKRSRKFQVDLPNGKKLDVSKLAIAFDKFVRLTNIGFSIPIAATSLVSAEIFLRIENYIGEHTNKNSASWATKEFSKLSRSYISEIGKINRDNKLYQLGERFRVYDLTERTTSSGFNRIMRASNQLPYKFTEMANFPIAPRIMLTILDDFRLVDGKFVDFNTFKKRSDVSGMNKKEITSKWNEYRDNSMYNLLESKNGVMEFSDELKEELGEEYLETQLSRVHGRIVRVNSNVDSVVPQEDKSAATRDFLMNFMTAHRGWLSIAIQRKLKRAHFNFQTGQFEEGHYVTLGRFIKQSYAGMQEDNFKNFIKVFKENWHTLDDYEKRNVKRVMTELGVYLSMLALGIVVAGIADDDDNKDLWALQFSAYIYFRATSEVGSVQAPTGAFGLVDTVQAPFIAINSVKEIMDVKGWSFDEVQSGAYEGHSKLYRKVMKQTWLRHLYDLKGIKKKSDYYRLLNAETLATMQK